MEQQTVYVEFHGSLGDHLAMRHFLREKHIEHSEYIDTSLWLRLSLPELATIDDFLRGTECPILDSVVVYSQLGVPLLTKMAPARHLPDIKSSANEAV